MFNIYANKRASLMIFTVFVLNIPKQGSQKPHRWNSLFKHRAVYILQMNKRIYGMTSVMPFQNSADILLVLYRYTTLSGAAVAQSVLCLTTDWTTGFRSPTEPEDFSSSPCVQTGSGAHPASCTMGTGGPFPGIKRGRGVTLTTHPHLVPRLRMSRR
jgi:hypothetical protein